ncbi:conserved Plasmodium protein, unknown function [Plasmodium knowlesi strain H]|uniref:Protein SOC1 n=3 Tax=Plasmodium knowlesi TaxID=5850 RepID=A0A5K1UAF7_PLAKH|nr:protein SOC1, putative [Plasmodium knowlesi strain H]OTN68108.1 Uncharacterized protein PKNOH_S04363200 [Plasmodium knowlesi]CAA9986992.1 protein SOC1, putative [Plasmodium knowlesi strain H]SBO26641.1 conserved Plasmodium protein, unknown function [Plasmodium knowlesi strain H]SBO28198.1 conserved Plasmodium protein, unknown function [Plasmodium knowlesi strain H]VVS76466.1 protein SOC1, putative [Plasmodium knowlesi strain H]|eukprot:XP_002258237.1 hypothetical protein, conserved in Plasmodium species [Plasmodium knowlesi strain H]
MDNGLYWKLKSECLPLDVSKHLEENDLEGLLSYEGLIQEIKAENYEVVNFLSKEENLRKIIKYITEESEDKGNYDKAYKFPYKCHQIINAENKLITDSLVYNDKLMKLFWSFVLRKNQLNEVLSGYFSRCAITIYNKNTTEVVNFLKRKKELYLKGFLYHFYSRNITELFKVLLFVKMPYLCIFDNKDIIFFILSNLNGNFSNETFIICDREDNITCLIRDIFVRKSEIYYFNYFLIDLSSQLSFSYLIKCVFSECPYTISAAITIISDLLHYTVLGKSYNTIDFYECLDLYTKEQDQKNKQLKQMEECKYTRKKKKKRKSNKVIDEEAIYNSSKAHASCVNQVRESDEILMGGSCNVYDQYGINGPSVGMPAGFATTPMNYSHGETPSDVDNIEEEEKREIEKSELEREKEGKVSSRGTAKVVTNVSGNSGEGFNANFYSLKQTNHVNKKIKDEMQTIGVVTPHGENDPEKNHNTLPSMTEELSKAEFQPEGDSPFSMQFESHAGEQYPHDEDPTEREIFKNGGVQTGEENKIIGDGVEISNSNGGSLSWDLLRVSENDNGDIQKEQIGAEAQSGLEGSAGESLLAHQNAVSYYYPCGDGSQEGDRDFLIGGNQRNEHAQVSNMHTYSNGHESEDNRNNGIGKIVKEAKNERNSDNDNCLSCGSDASSSDSSDDDNYDHLKKIKFEDVLNRMKRIASNPVHVKEETEGYISNGRNTLNRTQSNEKKKMKEDIFGIDSNNCTEKFPNASNNEEENFQIFESEKEGDINIPLNKWVQYLENGTFIDICFFSYIKDIMKLYIKNINKNKGKNMLGFTTLEIIQLIKTLIKTKSKNILTEIIDEGFFDISIDIFFKYKWNNLLHISVCDLMQTIIFKENEYSYLLYYILALTTFLPKCLRYFDAVRRCRNIKNKKRKKKIESLIDCGYKAHLLHICQILSNKSLEIKWLSNFLVTVSGWNDIIIEELNHYSLYFNDVNYGDEKRAEEDDHGEIISNGLCTQPDNSMTHHHLNNVGGSSGANRERLIGDDASGNSNQCMNRNYHYDEEEDEDDQQESSNLGGHGDRANHTNGGSGNGTAIQNDEREPRTSNHDRNDNCFNNYSNVIDILFDEHKNDYIKYEDEYHEGNSNYSLSSNCTFGNHDAHAEDMNRLDDNYKKQGDYGLGNYKGGYEEQEGHHKDGHPEGDPFANTGNSYLFDRGDGNRNNDHDRDQNHLDLKNGSDPFGEN